jgi:S1-C subfamily serine protease
MNRKQVLVVLLIAFFIGGIGGVVMGRFFIPQIASVTKWNWLNSLITTSPIVINRTTEVQLNEGVNLIDLGKQAGNLTVSISDPAGNFLGNGIIVSSDGLIFTSTNVLGKQTQPTVMINDGKKFAATVQTKDSKSGVGVLKIQASGLTTAQFDNAANLQAAQRVVFIGRGNVAFQHEVISALVTQSLANQTGEKKITTDGVIGVDYAGGPIINLSGRVVGLVVDGNQNITAENLQTALNTYLTK